MSKNESESPQALISIPQHDGTLDVSSRTDMEHWVARQEYINRVRFTFFVSSKRVRTANPPVS